MSPISFFRHENELVHYPVSQKDFIWENVHILGPGAVAASSWLLFVPFL